MSDDDEHLLDDFAHASVQALCEAVRPLLAGFEPAAQGGALAELVATFLAGHFADNPARTRELREALFEAFAEAVWQLVPECERVILLRTREAAQ